MSKLHEQFGPYTAQEVARAACAGGLDAMKLGEFFSYALNQADPGLRDDFASKAMVGLCHFWVQVHAKATINDPEPEIIARMAYEYADAMLKARQS